MQPVFKVAAAACIMAFAAATAGAADLYNQDDTAYQVTITTPNGVELLELASKTEARNICEGCEISLPDGQNVTVKTEDIVFIEGGKLEIDE